MTTNPPSGLHVVHQRGQGVQIVVVHGAMDRSVTFGRMLRSLPGRNVIRYDRRGYARSRGLGVGDLEAHVSDLRGVMGAEPTVIVGHSIGGVIALVAAAGAPSPVLGVVAYEAPMPWTDWWPRPRPATDPDGAAADAAEEAEAFMVRMVGERMWLRLPRSTREERRAEGEALRADIASLSGPAPFAPERIQVPVLAVTGSETTWYHERAARELAALVPGGELAVLEGATHGGHLSHPAELARIVAAFVDRATGARS